MGTAAIEAPGQGRGALPSALVGPWLLALLLEATRAGGFPWLAVAGGVALAAAARDCELRPLLALAGLLAAALLRLALPASDPLLGPTAPAAGLALRLLVVTGGALLFLRAQRQPAEQLLTDAGIAMVAASVAAALSAVMRIGARVGLGTPEDGIVFGAALAVVVLAGALSLGALLRSPSVKVAAALAAGAALLCLFALAVVGGVTSPIGFASLCERFGADRSQAGTLAVNAAVAATVLVAPGLALGAAVTGLRSASAWGWAAAGASVGIWASAVMLPASVDPAQWAASPTPSVGVVRAGGLLAIAGAVLVARPGPLAAGAGALLAASVALLPVSSIPVRRPWDRFPVMPAAMFETRAGQFTLEQRGSDQRMVFLDQRPLTPGPGAERLDARCIEQSLADVDLEGTRVALVGILTPPRAQALQSRGAASVDRLSSFPAMASSLETWMLGGPPAIAGQHLGLERASEYDLIIWPPVGALEAAGWRPWPWSGAAELRWSQWARPIMGAKLAEFQLAVDGLAAASIGSKGPASGWAQAPSALDWLSTRPDARARRAQVIGLDRIDNNAPEVEALRIHARGQLPSSPFEDHLEAIELEEGTLVALRSAAADVRSGPSRDLMVGAAEVLRAQGEVPWMFEFVAPVAAAHARRGAPFDALEVSVAWAEAQELRFEEAADRLAGVLKRRPADAGVARELSRSLVELGRGAEAARVLDPLHRADPSDRGLATDLAEALVVAGDPRGRPMAAELLREDPRNGRLMALARGLRSLTPEAVFER